MMARTTEGVSRALAVCVVAAMVVAPGVGRAEPGGVARGANQLGLRLLRDQLNEARGGNTVLSPPSIEAALAMTAVGAEGDTRAEMVAVLGLGEDEGAFADGLRSIGRDLTRAAEMSPPENRFEWGMANRLFGEVTYPFRSEALAFLRERYGSPLEAVDFRTAADGTRQRINGWVAEETRGRIADLIPPGGVDGLTRLVLVNALFLKAPWRESFPERATRGAPFYRRDGRTVEAPTMRHEASMTFLETARFTAVGVPYRDGALQAVVVVPAGTATIHEVLSELSVEDLERIGGAEPTAVDLALPKFTVRGEELDLVPNLRRLGLRHIFGSGADFGRFTDRRDIFVGNVFHKTFVAVDERGTEAAAATAVVMAKSLPMNKPAPRRVVVDRPFLFAIQHRPSGLCLFLGVIEDPTV